MVIYVLFAFLAIVLALWLKPISDGLLLPFPLVLVLLGFFGSELIVRLGHDTGIRFDNFNLICSHYLLPLVVFNTGFNFSEKIFGKDIVGIISFALLGLLLTVLISSLLLFFGIGYPQAFPWLAALLTGTLLSGTQAHVISDLLKKTGISKNIMRLLDGESLITDVLAVVFFGYFLTMALHQQAQHPIGYWFWQLLWSFGVAMISGYVISIILRFVAKKNNDDPSHALLTLVATYGSYFFVQDVLHASGALATFVVGLFLSKMLTAGDREHFLFNFWRSTTFIAITSLFLLVGVTFSIDMFTQRWLAMLIGIVAVLLARSIAVYSTLTFFSTIRLMQPLNFSDKTVVMLSGMRGALAIILAFSIPEQLEYWWTIQSITFGVVLFSIAIQAPIAARLIPRYI